MLRVSEAGVCAGRGSGVQPSSQVGEGGLLGELPPGKWCPEGYLRVLKNCFLFNRYGGDDSVFLTTWFIF